MAYWAFLVSLALFQACHSPQPAGRLAPLQSPLYRPCSALSPDSKCARVSLCFTTHTTVSPGLVPLFTTDCQGQAVLADGPTSSPHSTEPLHARSLEILSWWLSGHLSALAFLESNCPFRHLLPDLVLSLVHALQLGPLRWTAVCPQASVFSISGMIRPPLPWLVLVAVTFQGGSRPSVHGPLSVALPRHRQVLFLWLFLCTSR